MFRDVQADGKDENQKIVRAAEDSGVSLFLETLSPGTILKGNGFQPASKPGWQYDLGVLESIPDLNLNQAKWSLPQLGEKQKPASSIPNSVQPASFESASGRPWRASPQVPWDRVPGSEIDPQGPWDRVPGTGNEPLPPAKPWRGSPQVPWDRVPGSEIDPQGPWDRVPGTGSEPLPPEKPWRGSPQVPWDRVPGSEIDPMGPWDNVPGVPPVHRSSFEDRVSPWDMPSTDVASIPAPRPAPRPEPAPRPVPHPAPSFEPRPPQQVPRPPQSVPRPDSSSSRPAGNDGPWDKAPGAPWGKAPGGPWDRQTPGDGGAKLPTSGTAAEASRAFENDKVSRTSYSFDNAVDKLKVLGKENEVALELQMRDWLSKQNSMNPITHMRGTAVLASALGEFRLEEGSRIDLKSHADKKPRILKGYAYDFGGEANVWLRMAAGSLVAAQQYVVGHKDLVIDGQKMDDAYLNQLKGLQRNVESQLDIVYGPHDVDAVYGELVRQVRVNSGDWQQGLVRLKRQLDELQSPDKRYVAKASRDIALGFLAEADYMSSRNNGEEAKIMYREANQYLAKSMQLDPSAPDFHPIQQISLRLKPQIQKALDNQWNDPFNNPFEIPNPNNTVMV